MVQYQVHVILFTHMQLYVKFELDRVKGREYMAQTGIFQQRSAMTLNLDEQTWFKVTARFTIYPKTLCSLSI